MARKIPITTCFASCRDGIEKNMADALTVQSYYESILQSSGVLYDIIPIPAVSYVTPEQRFTNFYSYAFEKVIDKCILFINHVTYGSNITQHIIQYIPLETTPVDALDGGSYTPSVHPGTISYTNNRRMWVVRDQNTLHWYTYGNGVSYTGSNLTIGNVVALVTYP